MKLWLLKPVSGDAAVGPWDPWYDKVFGFVVRADTEDHARSFADDDSGDENRVGANVWLDPAQTSCVELTPDGADGVVLHDYRAA